MQHNATLANKLAKQYYRKPKANYISKKVVILSYLGTTQVQLFSHNDHHRQYT